MITSLIKGLQCRPHMIDKVCHCLGAPGRRALAKSQKLEQSIKNNEQSLEMSGAFIARGSSTVTL